MEAEDDWLNRTGILLGEPALRRLARAKVYVFGLGAVGSYAVEALARSGIGRIRLIDFDRVKPGNINRQLYALRSTLGRFKAEIAAERVCDINPAVVAEPVITFAHLETLPSLLDGCPDIVVDAVDSLNPKVEIIAAAAAMNVPVFSAFGAATRMDASRVRFGPLLEAKGCPLGRLVKKKLRRRGVAGDLWCVYSDEESDGMAVRPPEEQGNGEYARGRRRTVLGSLATLTGIFGLRLAHEVVLRLTNQR